MSKQLGVIGLGTMGANLARNAARNGAEVIVYNRTAEVTEKFLKGYGKEGTFKGAKSYKEFVQSLEQPRAILIMVKAGEAVDAVIEELIPHLSKGDILIDGGNSHYPDTDRREMELKKKGVHFIGMGVSGGEEGALEGPSMMPGVDKEAWSIVGPLLESMAADDGAGGKCVTPIGPGGAGHFVKMVHNGIEYGVMQLIAESAVLLKDIGGFTNAQLAETFDAWNEDKDLQSFLLEITSQIFAKKDGKTEIIEVIADRAGQKGTGKWTTEAAMTYGVSIPTINAAVDARILSGDMRRENRVGTFAYLDEHDPVPSREKMRSVVCNALELATIVTYQQGFDLIETASKENDWNIDISEVARIWRGGCIIRSALLSKYQAKYGNDKNSSLAAEEELSRRIESEKQLDFRRAVTKGANRGIPIPAFSASLHYYDAFRADHLPQSIIQAQRDYFGAHTYERVGKKGVFHTEWI
jgi:6-phosphogluconate dehydrogenase